MLHFSNANLLAAFHSKCQGAANSMSLIGFTGPSSCSHSGSSTPITTEHLQAVTNDNSRTSNRTITFNVIRRPKLGSWWLVAVQAEPDNSTLDISTFTQDMV